MEQKLTAGLFLPSYTDLLVVETFLSLDSQSYILKEKETDC